MKWRSIRPDGPDVEIPTSGPQIPIQQARHVHARESDVESLATRLERIVDGKWTIAGIGSTANPCKTSSTIRQKAFWEPKEDMHLHPLVVSFLFN
jgi:hypothetical protein